MTTYWRKVQPKLNSRPCRSFEAKRGGRTHDGEIHDPFAEFEVGVGDLSEI